MSLFQRSFKISLMKNNRWHVVEVGEAGFKTFPTLDLATAYIKEQLKEKENEQG
jgi:hypothetical protein